MQMRSIALVLVVLVIAGGLIAQAIDWTGASPPANAPTTPPRAWGDDESDSDRLARREAIAHFMHDKGWIDLDEVEDLRNAMREQWSDPAKRDQVRAFVQQWEAEQVRPDPAEVIEARGVQVGERLPRLMVLDVDGRPTPLVSPDSDGYTLLVTGSISSPAARRTLEKLPALANAYGDRLRVVVLYVAEAVPPRYDRRSQRRDRDETERPSSPDYRRPQPTTVGQRIETALELQELVGLPDPPLLDTLENSAFEALGAGPNMAVLLAPDGTILAKQGHFYVGPTRALIDQHMPPPQ